MKTKPEKQAGERVTVPGDAEALVVKDVLLVYAPVTPIVRLGFHCVKQQSSAAIRTLTRLRFSVQSASYA